MYMEKFKRAVELNQRMKLSEDIQKAFNDSPNHTKIIITNHDNRIEIMQTGFGGELIEDFKKLVEAHYEKAMHEFADL